MASSSSHDAAARPAPTESELQQYLEENNKLLEAILQNQNMGRLHECVQYQLQLQQNLIYLATHADQDPRLVSLAMSAQAPEPDEDDEDEQEEQPAARAVGGRAQRTDSAGALLTNGDVVDAPCRASGPRERLPPFTHEEDETILRMVQEIGNKWTTIAKSLPGRTDGAVRNRHAKLQLLERGTAALPSDEHADAAGSLTQLAAAGSADGGTLAATNGGRAPPRRRPR